MPWTTYEAMRARLADGRWNQVNRGCAVRFGAEQQYEAQYKKWPKDWEPLTAGHVHQPRTLYRVRLRAEYLQPPFV